MPVLLLLSAALSACGGEPPTAGPRTGDNGCPAHLDDVQASPCEAKVLCEYYAGGCATDWSCDTDGEWRSQLSCSAPSDGEWCDVQVILGGDCWPIELTCPRTDIVVPCDEPTPAARCGPDYTWEPVPDLFPACVP